MVSPPARVTLVVTNRNGMRHLEECFESIGRQTYRDFETVFVDNDSTDGSVDWVREHASGTALIVHDVDMGWSGSANDGIRAAQGDYVVLLNNDVRLEPDWLESLVCAMDAHPGYDFGASLMIMYCEPDLTNAAGDTYSLRLVSGVQRGWAEPTKLFSEPKRVLGACAGAAIYRRAFFEDVGLFDEEFYLTHEDTDLNLRALIAGKRCLYIPNARIFHKIRSSGEQFRSDELARLELRNRLIVAAKNLPLSVLWICLAVRGLAAMKNTFWLRPSEWRRIPFLVRSLPQRVAPEVEGFRLGWAKRREVWSKRLASHLTILRWLIRGVSDV
jgi:hypothetical protein